MGKIHFFTIFVFNIQIRIWCENFFGAKVKNGRNILEKTLVVVGKVSIS